MPDANNSVKFPNFKKHLALGSFMYLVHVQLEQRLGVLVGKINETNYFIFAFLGYNKHGKYLACNIQNIRYLMLALACHT